MRGRRSHSGRVVLVGLAAWLALVRVAAAQGVDPGQVRPTPPPPLPAKEEDSFEVLPPLTPPQDPDERLDGGLTLRVTRFVVEGTSVFEPEVLERTLAPWTGRTLSIEDLLAARDALTDLYVAHGYVTSGATIPDQDAAGGVVHLQIVEGQLAEVTVAGNHRFRDHYFRSRLERAGAAPVNVQSLETALQRLQRDPWIERVDAVLEPGATLGESRLVVSVVEAHQWQTLFKLSNERSPAVGSAGGVIDGQIANVIGLRDIWTFRYEQTLGLLDLEARFEMALNSWDTRFRFRFRDTSTKIVEAPFDELDITADSRTYGVSFFQPVYRTDLDEVWLELTGEYRTVHSQVLGFDFCFEDVRPGCETVSETVLRMGGQWTRRTQTDVFALRSILSVGLGIFGATVVNDPDAPDGEFVAWLAQAQWAHVLPEYMLSSQAVFRLDGQLANQPLLAIEKFAIGGHLTVRGYRMNQLVRDNGAVVSGELRIPVWRDDLHRPILEIIPFMDYGYASNVVDLASTQRSLWSVGAGLRFMPREGFLFEFSWGGRLEDTPINPHKYLQDYGIYMGISVFAPTIL